MSLLVGTDISKRFKERIVVDNITIAINKGDAIGIAGSTGSGKSTMLRILAGLIEPDEGTVVFDGKKVEGPLTKLLPGHDKIAYLSQHFELRNNYRVEEIFDYSNRLEIFQANEIFERCQINHLLKRRTDELSGGEKQRIALARVLVTKPSVLLLDEPFSNLDLIQKNSLKSVLANVIEAFELTTVLVSHDPDDLLPFARIIYIMRGGKIVQTGSPAEIYYNPQDEYAAGLMGQYSIVDERLSSKLFPAGRRFIRPEMMQIVAENEGHINAVVKNNAFMGGHWQARALADGFELIINNVNPLPAAGTTVGIYFLANMINPAG